MMKCVVNVIGYARLKSFDDNSTNGTILPFVGKDENGVFAVNSFGNMIHVSFRQCDVI